MVISTLILILSTAFFFFYLQATCQRILRQQFDREYFLAIVNANLLEFPAVRRTLEDSHAPLDYRKLRTTLKCDFLALAYLLKNAANMNQRHSLEERLLMFYFRLTFASLIIRHWLRMREKPAILRLTGILQYFANMVGQRMNIFCSASLAASD